MTCFIVVPRIIQKVVDGITTKLEQGSALKQRLFNALYDQRLAVFKKIQHEQNSRLWDGVHKHESAIPVSKFSFPALTNLVFKQFPAMLGGRCRIIVSGSAPLSQKHGEFMAICFNTHVIEGFGMSESAAHGCIQK